MGFRRARSRVVPWMPIPSLFEYGHVRVGSPQIWPLSPIHTLGKDQLSRLFPQACHLMEHQGRSEGCGFVRKHYPQAVDERFFHRFLRALVHRGSLAAHRQPGSVHKFSTALSTVRQRNARSH